MARLSKMQFGESIGVTITASPVDRSTRETKLTGMKYIVAKVETEELSEDYRRLHGLEPLLNTEDEAIKYASKFAQRNPGTTYGVYKLIKKCEPPAVTVKDVE
jgi:hypothetical protein